MQREATSQDVLSPAELDAIMREVQEILQLYGQDGTVSREEN